MTMTIHLQLQRSCVVARFSSEWNIEICAAIRYVIPTLKPKRLGLYFTSIYLFFGLKVVENEGLECPDSKILALVKC